MMIDTCFLIDYQREAKAGTHGQTIAFLEAHPDERLSISPIAWGEFMAGFQSEEDPYIAFARDRLDFPHLSMNVALAYRHIYRHLKTEGRLISSNDLWIACHAITLKLPLLTRKGSDSRRVPDLITQEY
ncbi:MAG: type II toxin-antitoxin system VapC family toxin [Verrucomicrobiota bacterium]